MAIARLWRYSSSGDPIIIAHRGGGGEAPENSHQAFARLRRLGMCHIETDVRTTQDGVVVICHDPIVDRVSDGHGLISDYTWAELSKLRDLSGKPFMRLDEVLQEFPEMIFNIDAKDRHVVVPLAATIIQEKASNRVCIASFSEWRLAKLRAALPQAATSLGLYAVAQFVVATYVPSVVRRAILRHLPSVADGVQAIQVPRKFAGIPLVTRRFVETAHAQSWAVHVWTVNDLEEAQELAELGVDGIITDIPFAMSKILGD